MLKSFLNQVILPFKLENMVFNANPIQKNNFNKILQKKMAIQYQNDYKTHILETEKKIMIKEEVLYIKFSI